MSPHREATVQPSAIDLSELDYFLSKHRHLFQRAAVLIRKKGQIIYSAGDTDTPIFAASCSKWVSAATIMRLVENHILQLDAPVQTYLPNVRPQVAGLTLRQLLSHTAGLAAHNKSVGDAELPFRRFTAANLRFLREDTPSFCYENAGVNFAGKVAVKTAQKPWSRIFAEEMAAPLHLTASYYTKNKPTLAAGGLFSASDYSKFLEMIRNNGVSMNGERVLSEHSIHEILRNHTQGMAMKCIPRPSPRKESHGLGVWRQGSGERPDLASHFGVSGYKVFVDFCRDVSAVFAMEYKPSKKEIGRNLTRDIFGIVQRAIPATANCGAEDAWTPPLLPPQRN